MDQKDSGENRPILPTDSLPSTPSQLNSPSSPSTPEEASTLLSNPSLLPQDILHTSQDIPIQPTSDGRSPGVKKPHSGSWKKGQSGNPNGRKPSSSQSFRSLVRKKSNKALEVIMSIMLDPKSPASDRIKAARTVLEYGIGKPIDPTSPAPVFPTNVVVNLQSPKKLPPPPSIKSSTDLPTSTGVSTSSNSSSPDSTPADTSLSSVFISNPNKEETV